MSILDSFPAVSDFFKSCFPQEDKTIPGDLSVYSEQADNIANTLPREDLIYFRHPLTQAGIVMNEDGSIEIRSGNSNEIGSSIVLHQNGTITLIAPRGLAFSGKTNFFPSSASDSFTFNHGSTTFNPLWEKESPVYLNPVIPENLSLLCITPSSPVPIPIPLNLLFESEPLYATN